MEKIIGEENQQSLDAAMMLQSINWKERKEILLRMRNEPELVSLFVLNVERLLKDTNIVCLELILQILDDNIDKFTFQLPEIANILTNVVLQNTKTSIKSTAIGLVQRIHGMIPHEVAETLGQAALSNNPRFARQCLEIMQIIGGEFISGALSLPLQHKNAEIKNFALNIAKEQLENPQSLEAMEHDFPPQLFEQILVEAVESVSVDNQEESKPQPQVVKVPTLRSEPPLDSSKQETGGKDLDFPILEKLQWKEKKACLDQLALEIEQGSNVSYDFGRQLKYLIDNEANSACENALIRLGEVCALHLRQWKYARPVFVSILEKLREKRALSQAHRALPSFFIHYLRLQDIVDEFISCLESRETDEKQETAIFLRSLFTFEQGNTPEYSEESAEIINANCVFEGSESLARLIEALIVLLNDSVLAVRTAGEECLVELIRLHMCTNAHILVLWDLVFGEVLMEPRCEIATVERLVCAIEHENFLGKASNEYKRLLEVVIGIENVLLNYHATSSRCDLYALFGLSEPVTEQINRICGQPTLEQLDHQAFLIDNVSAETPGKRAHSTGVLVESPNRSPARRNTSGQSEESREAMAESPYPEELSMICPVRHEIDVMTLFPQEISALELGEEHGDTAICTQLETEILELFSQIDPSDLPVYLDAVVDLISVVYSQRGPAIIEVGVEFVTELIRLYETEFNPQTLVKLFDVLVLILDSSEAREAVRLYLESVTLLYGYEPLISLIISEIGSGNPDPLLEMLTSLAVNTGLVDFREVGLDPNINVFNTNLKNERCNIFVLSQLVLQRPKGAAQVQLLMNTMSVESERRFAQEIEQFLGVILEIMTNISEHKQVVTNPLTKPHVQSTENVRSKIQSPQLVGSPQQRKEELQQAQQSVPKRPQKPEKHGLKEIENLEDGDQIYEAPSNDKIEHISSDTSTKTTFKLKTQIENHVGVNFEEPFDGLTYFLARTSDAERGVNLEPQNKELIEDFCYLLIELFEISDEYLVECFPNGALNVPSSDAQFSQLVHEIIEENEQTWIIEAVILRMLVIMGGLYDIANHEERMDCIIHAVSMVFSGYNEFLTVFPALEVILRLVVLSDSFEVNRSHFSALAVLVSSKVDLIQIVLDAAEFFSSANKPLRPAFSDLIHILVCSIAEQNEPMAISLLLDCIFILGDILSREDSTLLTATLNTLIYMCYREQIPLDEFTTYTTRLLADKIYSIDQRFIDFGNNLTSSNTETYITAQKQIILLAREKKSELDNPIILEYVSTILSVLRTSAAEKREFDYRLLKYAALVLIELVESRETVIYFDYLTTSNIVEISSYYALESLADEEYSSGDLDELKIKEVEEYFEQVVIKLQQSTDKTLMFAVFWGLLVKVYEAIIGSSVQVFPFTDLPFCNQLETTYIMKFLLLNQTDVVQEFKFAVAYTYEYHIRQFPFSKSPLPHISSISSNGAFTEIAERTGLPEKDIKLLFRFCKNFAELCPIGYSSSWDNLVKAIQEKPQGMESSLGFNWNTGNAAELIRSSASFSQSPKPSKTFENPKNNQIFQTIHSPVSESEKLIQFSFLAFKQDPLVYFNGVLAQALELIRDGNQIGAVCREIERAIKDPRLESLMIVSLKAEAEVEKVRSDVAQEIGQSFQ